MKYLYKVYLFITWLLLLASAFLYRSPTVLAVSSGVVIYQVQTAGSGGATQEFIALYNQSNEDVLVSDWCVQYFSAADNAGFKKCITTELPQTELWLSAGGFVTFATNEFVAANPSFTPDFVFSSGMSGTSGHLRLFDATETEVDRVGWGTALHPETAAVTTHPTGKVLGRDLSATPIDTDNNLADFSSQDLMSVVTSGMYEKELITDQCPNIDGTQPEVPLNFLQDATGDCYEDVCPNLDDLQKIAPEGYILNDETGMCDLIPLENRQLFITELYPNAPSSDTGEEFIELHNPNNEVIELKGYRLQVGPSYATEYVFEDGVISAGQYLIFSDIVTGITLPNTSGVRLRLLAPAGNTVSETDSYTNASEETSWALLGDLWSYTNQITPEANNKPYLEKVVVEDDEVVSLTTVLAPCPVGKYRNPQTNRCRNQETIVSTLQPCDEDEYRNPETNRCRKVLASTTIALMPCGAGKERNPLTNRCRNIVTATSTLTPCEEGEERNPETNRCRKVTTLSSGTESLASVRDLSPTPNNTRTILLFLGLGIGTTGYLVYEWRHELRGRFRKK